MRILIADDEKGIRTSLSELLGTDHDVILCEDGESALRKIEVSVFDLVITDHQMPKITGIELIKRGKELSPQTSFMLMSAYGSVDQAVLALKTGADDYFMKPFEFDEILHRVQKISELRDWNNEKVLKGDKPQKSFTGNSIFISKVKEFVSKVASVHSPVLILGPSGSGKEVLSKTIHETGPRSERPFIAINCASLTEQLMESELFGHEKGAFTGATQTKLGKFELASGGTLFLDEIGELSQNLQAKLLRVLQEKEFFRVGGVRQIKTTARVIAATHRQLKEMVKQGTFREDLFFRLNILTFEMAALVERKEDLPELLDFFWKKHTREIGRRLTLSEGAHEKLLRYSYPGNIRELQNVLERLVVLGPDSGIVGIENLPPEISGEIRGGAVSKAATHPISTDGFDEAVGMGLTEYLDHHEELMIQKAMEVCGYNQIRAAELLKINRGTLQYKLKKYGITKAEAA